MHTAHLTILVLAMSLPVQIRTLGQEDSSPTLSSNVSDLELEPTRKREVENAIKVRDYKRAETILIEEADREPKSERTARLLALAGGILFLDGQYLNAAIAWKKAEAIAPLDERSRFTLAMSYIKLNRRDWARPELEKLAASRPQNPLYMYWLARLDYDAQRHRAAIARLNKVIELDPKMMRGYDLLGLCYDYIGQFEEAIKNYNRAIELNRLQPRPSPWPHIDLAVSLIALNRLAEAEESLRQALTYDGQLPQAHFQMGRVLEKKGELQAATVPLERAATLAAAYPEPHLLLARIYRRLNQPQKAEAEITLFQRLKEAAEASSSNSHEKLSPPSN